VERRKFLKLIGNMNYIYRTDKFRNEYEIQAKNNINRILYEKSS